jgi:hypothetical protein
MGDLRLRVMVTQENQGSVLDIGYSKPSAFLFQPWPNRGETGSQSQRLQRPEVEIMAEVVGVIDIVAQEVFGLLVRGATRP